MKMYLIAAAAAALLAFAAGCSSDGTQDPPASAEPPPMAAEAPEDRPAPPPAVEPAVQLPETEPAEKPDAGGEADDRKDGISVASPQTEQIEPEPVDDLYMNEEDRELIQATAPGNEGADGRSYDVTGAFDPQHPTLMGIALGTDADEVIARFGEPTEKHLLPDESVEAAVFVYPGFSIGVRDGAVLFVEVSTRSVNPGLNGARLGDTREETVGTLGVPTTDTEFVVSYVADGAVLKLDVDPETDRIHSIKLFPEE